MQRRVLTCLLSVFLLLMQHEALRHTLDHVGAQLGRIDHSMLERPTGDTCAECGLLAGTSASIPSVPSHAAVAADRWIAIAEQCASLTTDAPSYYRSRAPPFVLQRV